MNETELPVRLAGRVIAIDPAGQVLLFYYDDPPPMGRHWTTPGGGVEPGEDFYAAACRELAEETGWTDVTVAPARVHWETNLQWTAQRTLVRQHNHYFIGWVTAPRRPLGDVAVMHDSDGIVSHRWWALSELDATAEAVYPPGLAGLVRTAIASAAAGPDAAGQPDGPGQRGRTPASS